MMMMIVALAVVVEHLLELQPLPVLKLAAEKNRHVVKEKKVNVLNANVKENNVVKNAVVDVSAKVHLEALPPLPKMTQSVTVAAPSATKFSKLNLVATATCVTNTPALKSPPFLLATPILPQLRQCIFTNKPTTQITS